jgi:hypothetical protein
MPSLLSAQAAACLGVSTNPRICRPVAIVIQLADVYEASATSLSGGKSV